MKVAGEAEFLSMLVLMFQSKSFERLSSYILLWWFTVVSRYNLSNKSIAAGGRSWSVKIQAVCVLDYAAGKI